MGHPLWHEARSAAHLPRRRAWGGKDVRDAWRGPPPARARHGRRRRLAETYNRKLTAQLLGGLEIVPRRAISYRGSTFEEMDLDAVLARKPEVALVDEL